jgi:hypothetical protein
VPATLSDGDPGTLRAITDGPAAAARLYLPGDRPLLLLRPEQTDGASIAVGYGPICAERLGPPDGDGKGVKGGYREHSLSAA